ncbi:hypothetical protein SD457_25260 [Coprobacillaceae bacterium CR2/5/TPMF4]|nr:hypothetical protein SD457_25260 [Coprobacillaceae bacterium CR2/5/TPMF4]
MFISGRSGQFTDVLIDSTGCLIMLLFLYLWQKRKMNLMIIRFIFFFPLFNFIF